MAGELASLSRTSGGIVLVPDEAQIQDQTSAFRPRIPRTQVRTGFCAVSRHREISSHDERSGRLASVTPGRESTSSVACPLLFRPGESNPERPRRTAMTKVSVRSSSRSIARASDGDGAVRYAVVGLGYIAQVAVLPAFRHARRNSRLVALVSDDEVKRKELSRKYGV